MGKIAEAIEKENASLELLANYLDMLPSLLLAMDNTVDSIPENFKTAIWLFCKERDRYKQSIIDRLNTIKTDVDNQERRGLFLVYPEATHYLPDSGYDITMPYVIQRHFQEYAAADLPQGYSLQLIEFKPDEYFVWLGEQKDSESARQIWMVRQSVELAATA